MPISFAADIRPPFRDRPDVDMMQGYSGGLRHQLRATGLTERDPCFADRLQALLDIFL